MKKQTTHRDSFKILASGKGWIAVDKPAGISVHNDPGRDLCALVANRLQVDTDLKNATGLNGRDPLSAAHRLDRETSGVILLAGDKSVLSHFATQFENRTVDKHYTAIVHGRLPAGTDPDGWATWNWPLTKTAGGRKNPRGKGPRKESTTLVRVLNHSDHYTLVACKLLTGRKHQIRRHAKLAGNPVVGDRRYGSKRALDFLKHKHAFKRLGLHATRLEIQLPDGSSVVIRAPELPDEMQRLFAGDSQTAGLNTKTQP
jgi:RluA family pseudouridine synthase